MDHIMGRPNYGQFRVESDLTADIDFDFDTWMIWNVRKGTDDPVETGIHGLDNAVMRCRQLNDPGPRYRVKKDFQRPNPFSNHDNYWSIYDMWNVWVTSGEPIGELYEDEELAEIECEKLNTP